MKQQGKQALTGILALVGLLGVAAVLFFVARDSGWLPGGGGPTLEVRLDAAPGVRAGTPLTVGGVRIGRVRRITFADATSLAGGFVVECVLHRGLSLHRGSSAQVVALGPTGGQTAIEIVPGPAGEPALESGAAIRGEALSTGGTLLPQSLVWALERSADRIGLAAESLAPALTDVQKLVEPRLPAAVDAGSGAGNIASAITRIDQALAGLNEVLGSADARRKLRETLDNLHAASTDGRALLADARATFVAARGVVGSAEQTLAESRAGVAALSRDLTEATVRLNRTLETASAVLSKLDPLAARLARGEGSLGKLIADDRVYEGFVLLLRKLNEERR